MQQIPSYIPYDRYRFDGKQCFLSGVTPESSRLIPVFPGWLQERYGLGDRPFRLLDESYTTYGALLVPCTPEVDRACGALEEKVRNAFEKGYEGVSALSELELFQWVGRFMLALIYKEFEVAVRQSRQQGDAEGPLEVSPELLCKLGNVHLLMQSLYRPVVFEQFTPWSVCRFKINREEDTFDYRDETNTLTFSMTAGDTGVVVCLQDNGENNRYHRELLRATGEKALTPRQFREICARLYYSAWLFNRVPQYLTVMPDENHTEFIISCMDLQETDPSPVFDTWENKVYAQVLEAFWKPWEISRFEILKDPEKPMSVL